MADDVLVDNGQETDYTVATDDDGSGNHVQIVKLAQSANGSRTPISADASGMLVNLGVNNDVTVDGVATEAKQDDEITQLTSIAGDASDILTAAVAIQAAAEAIQASVETLDDTVGGSELQVDVVTSTLPSGASTSAKQDTIIGHVDGIETLLTAVDGHVDGIEGLLTTIDGDTGTLAGAVAGSEMQVDVVTLPAIPAGNNNIGDVDVASVPADPFGANADAAATAGATGSMQAKLRRLTADLDSVKTTATAIDGHVDGLETSNSAIQAAAEIMADWDESDRAKVNVIVGNAGVTGNTGTVDAGTQRVTLATNVALPSGTNAIGKLAANSGVDIGDVDVTSVPADPFGANADAAASAGGTGSIQAKLRLMTSQLDAIKTAVELIDDTIFADDVGFTPGTSKVSVIGFQADESSTDSVDEGDAGAPRMTLDRKQITTLQPHTKGGLLVAKNLDVDESEDTVKASAGQLYGYYIYNAHATAVRYVKYYNDTTANVTVGTTVPVITIPVPPLSAANLMFPYGITFDTAITIAATTGLADNNSGAPGADEVIVNSFYF